MYTKERYPTRSKTQRAQDKVVATRTYTPRMLCAIFTIVLTALFAFGCTTSSPQNPEQAQGNNTPSSSQNTASSFTPHFSDAEFTKNASETDGANYIDLSHLEEGYIGAAAENENRLKLQVSCGDQSYNYDLPSSGEPIIVPLNMGNGTYLVRIMQNTTEDRYIELFEATCDVSLTNDFEPFIRPNMFCSYTRESECVSLASELCANATSESEAFDAIYDYICNNIDYDHEKAASLATVTGYVPNPDETLSTKSGICFDYASLAAAMLRSQGIPTKILTGYVSPDNVYHAWDMIYIEGSWVSLHISAKPGQWARADMTFAANGAEDTIGDASSYAERYTY